MSLRYSGNKYALVLISVQNFPTFQVPGLFEGDEYTTLMTQCKEGSQRDGLMLDSSEELYKWFTEQVSELSHTSIL